MLRINQAYLYRYGVAILASFLALLLRLILEPVLNGTAPLLVFMVPVMLSAWYGGFGPGLLATILSALVGSYFFLPTIFTTNDLTDSTVNKIVQVSIFLLNGILISLLSQSRRLARKRAQAASLSLEESEERYRLLVDGVRDYAIFLLDVDGHIMNWNTGAERIHGYETIEVLQQNFALLYLEEDSQQHQPEQELQMAAQLGRIEKEEWQKRKNGSLFLANAVTTALRDKNGNVRGYARIVRDITERRQAENELQRSNQRLAVLHDIYRAILEAKSPVELVRTALFQMSHLVPSPQSLVVLFDFESQEAKILAGSVSNLRPPEGTVISIQEIIPDQQLIQDLTNYTEYVSSPCHCPSLLLDWVPEAEECIRVPLIVERTLLGELIVFLASSDTCTDEDRQVMNEVGSQLAIAIHQSALRQQLQHYTTELEQRVIERTAQLQEACIELESFSYSTAHDLRTPLVGLQGLCQALLDDYGNVLDDYGQEYTRRIYETARRMDQLVDDLLTYSRVSRTDLKLEPVNLNTVIAEAINQLQEKIQQQQANIIIAEQVPGALAQLNEVIAHKTTLIQVVVNILSNAIKFVQPGIKPQIYIWAEEVSISPEISPLSTKVIRLWIQDNGIGIPAEYKDRIFRVFERLHGEEAYPGTGIGLAIVRKGMERMGGRVGVESQINQGSQFWLELPKAHNHKSN